MKLSEVHSVYFIGIGGIGMSAIARFFLSRHRKVYGYDRTASALTNALVDEGAEIVYEDDDIHAVPGIDLVVYTPAVKEGALLTWYQQHNYTLMKRSEVLGLITSEGLNICIAGTHGKTSVSSMVAHLLRHADYGCNAFLGGISANYQTNYWSHDRDVFVVEADEFDRSFLRLRPSIAVVTSTDPDHLDIYGHEASFDEAFKAFVGLIRQNGLLICHSREEALAKSFHGEAWLYHGSSDTTDSTSIRPENIRLEGRGFRFDVVGVHWSCPDIYMPVDGLHNIENMTAAIAVAKYLEINDLAIREAVSAYRGVRRRFEYHAGGEANDVTTYIDDYAHHPTELEALIKSIRYRYPEREITMLFQPHLFSRTRDFSEDFARVLGQVDELILLPIYPAREAPMEGVTSEWLKSLMAHQQRVSVMEKQDALDFLAKNERPLIVTAGAGDIDQLVVPVASICMERNKLN